METFFQFRNPFPRPIDMCQANKIQIVGECLFAGMCVYSMLVLVDTRAVLHALEWQLEVVWSVVCCRVRILGTEPWFPVRAASGLLSHPSSTNSPVLNTK